MIQQNYFQKIVLSVYLPQYILWLSYQSYKEIIYSTDIEQLMTLHSQSEAFANAARTYSQIAPRIEPLESMLKAWKLGRRSFPLRTSEFSSGVNIGEHGERRKRAKTRRIARARQLSNICSVDLISSRKVRRSTRLPSEIAFNDFHEYEWLREKNRYVFRAQNVSLSQICSSFCLTVFLGVNN